MRSDSTISFVFHLHILSAMILNSSLKETPWFALDSVTPLKPLFPVIRAPAHVPPSFPGEGERGMPCPSEKGYESWVWRPSLLFFYRFRALGVGNREYITDLAEQIRRKRDRAMVSAVWSMTTARRRTVIRNGINCTNLSAISLPSVILNHIDHKMLRIMKSSGPSGYSLSREIRPKGKLDINRFKNNPLLVRSIPSIISLF